MSPVRQTARTTDPRDEVVPVVPVPVVDATDRPDREAGPYRRFARRFTAAASAANREHVPF